MSGSAVRKQISPLICAICTVPILMTLPWCSTGSHHCLHVTCYQPNLRELTGKFCRKVSHLVDLAALMTISASCTVVHGHNLSRCWVEGAHLHVHSCRKSHGFWSAMGFLCCIWVESRQWCSWAQTLLWQSAMEAVPPSPYLMNSSGLTELMFLRCQL